MAKSEKEKMLAGEYYDPTDNELITRWYLAKRLTQAYNNTDPADAKERDAVLDQLLGSRGKNLLITAPFFVDYGENIHFGDNCELNMNCVFLDCSRITIGDNTGLGPGVHIYAVGHPVDPRERLDNADGKALNKWRSMTAPVKIGSNVWIGGGSIVLPGVTIGDNTTIGAGSVVSKSIPANSLAVGNPCRVIKTFE